MPIARAMARGMGRGMRASARGWGVMGRGAIRAPGRAGVGAVRGAGRAGVGGLRWAGNHPRTAITAAALAGAGVGLAQSATTPQVQEAVFGSPTALSDIARERAVATFLGGYNPSDRNNPRSAMNRSGTVLTTPNYLYGRPVQGAFLGDIAGSRTLGGYTLNPDYRNRIRGSGREQPANGAMVFGMYNLRR